MKLITAVPIFISLLLTACQSVVVTPTSSPVPTVHVPKTPLPTSTPARSPTATLTNLAPLSDSVQGGAITVGLVGQPQTLNPITENNPALRELTPLLFDSLLQVDSDSGRLQPGLAHRWEFASNGRNVTFHLPPNLKWSDGSALSAATIAESLQATQHPALRSFRKINATNDHRLTLEFINIDCGALTTLSLLPLLPADQILETAPVGSGPFVATTWSENQRTLSLTRNLHFRNDGPFLDKIIVRFIRENEAHIALSEGQFDAFGPLQANLPGSIPDYLIDMAFPAPHVIYIAINYEPRNEVPLPPQIRQALLLALDREAMLAEVLGGDGQLMAGSLLPSHWAANKAISPPAYDPEEARNLLDRVGLADRDLDGWLDWEGQPLQIGIRVNGNNPLHQRLGWLASSYYRDLGLLARAESVPPDSLLDDLFTHDFNLAIFSWLILPDPDQRLYWLSSENKEGIGLNFTSYNNRQLDTLLESGIAIAGCQPEERAESYVTAQEIISQDRPVDFLLTPNRHVFVSSQLRGPAPGPFAPFTWNIADWFLIE